MWHKQIRGRSDEGHEGREGHFYFSEEWRLTARQIIWKATRAAAVTRAKQVLSIGNEDRDLLSLALGSGDLDLNLDLDLDVASKGLSSGRCSAFRCWFTQKGLSFEAPAWKRTVHIKDIEKSFSCRVGSAAAAAAPFSQVFMIINIYAFCLALRWVRCLNSNRQRRRRRWNKNLIYTDKTGDAAQANIVVPNPGSDCFSVLPSPSLPSLWSYCALFTFE